MLSDMEATVSPGAVTSSKTVLVLVDFDNFYPDVDLAMLADWQPHVLHLFLHLRHPVAANTIEGHDSCE